MRRFFASIWRALAWRKYRTVYRTENGREMAQWNQRGNRVRNIERFRLEPITV